MVDKKLAAAMSSGRTACGEDVAATWRKEPSTNSRNAAGSGVALVRDGGSSEGGTTSGGGEQTTHEEGKAGDDRRQFTDS
jgi:hypothetical protein